MKKLVLALIVALTLAPFSAFGLEMMTDDSLKDTTAQAGVVIALDDVTLVQHTNMTTMYIDDDGLSANDAAVADTAAGLYIKDMGTAKRTIRINALYNGSNDVLPAFTALGLGVDNWGASGGTEFGYGIMNHKYAYGVADGFFVQQALTIDIGKCPILSAGMANMKTRELIPGVDLQAFVGMVGATAYADYNLGMYLHMDEADFNDDTLVDIIGVNISLPTVEIRQDYEKHCREIGVKIVEANATGDGYNIVTRDGATAGAAADGYVNAKEVDHFIKIQKEGESTLAITSGKLEIAPK
jgi:hypothetical protein